MVTEASYNILGQITEEDGPKTSLFHYKAGEGVETFRNDSFQPTFTDEVIFSDPDMKKRAMAVCGNVTSCLYDVSMTNDIEVGEVSVRISDSHREAVEGRGMHITTHACAHTYTLTLYFTCRERYRKIKRRLGKQMHGYLGMHTFLSITWMANVVAILIRRDFIITCL